VPETVLFDRYRLLEPAGRGGSAEVWRALDLRTGDEVAVKRLHPVVFADEAGRRRLEREFDALRGLDEPHIVRVRDLHVGEREAALILDYIAGESLAERLAGLTAAGRRMPPDRAVAIVADVASALTAAHAAGIVHRDVTPGNILLGNDGAVRLTDFGIAHASTDATAVTATGLLMGTMRFLAPEQLRAGATAPATDLHALAAVAYEMLAGRPAYAATSPVALAEAQEAGPPAIDGVPPAVDAAVRRGLAVDPADRPADVRTFATSIAAALAASTLAAPLDDDELADQQTTAIPVPAMAAMTAPIAATGRGTASPPSSRTARRRIPAPLVAVIGAIIAAAALAAAATTTRPFSEPSQTRGADAAPSSTPRPTARVTPAPTENPGKGDDDDKGKGKGNGKGDGD
jgi:serine/threonine-protein kinase